jgi:hypothetical protein
MHPEVESGIMQDGGNSMFKKIRLHLAVNNHGRNRCANSCWNVDIKNSSCRAPAGRYFRVVRIDQVPTAGNLVRPWEMPQLVAQGSAREHESERQYCCM